MLKRSKVSGCKIELGPRQLNSYLSKLRGDSVGVESIGPQANDVRSATSEALFLRSDNIHDFPYIRG